MLGGNSFKNYEIEIIMNCKLCEVTENSLDNDTFTPKENQVLYQTPDFIITPCIGPIVPGHIMIISKKHYQNLSCMDLGCIEQIEGLLNILFSDFSSIYKNAIIAEHGALNEERKSGACIIHTHLHVIPEAKHSLTAFEKILNRIKLNSLEEIQEINMPYILVIDSKRLNLFNADGTPSQTIRKIVLASKGNFNNWDWRSQEINNYNDLTIEYWREFVKHN